MNSDIGSVGEQNTCEELTGDHFSIYENCIITARRMEIIYDI